MANSRKDWTHKQTTAVVTRARLIAVGSLSTRLAKTRFATSTYDARWGTLRALLEYKAKRLEVVYCEVNERWSSVTCSACLHRTGPSGLRALGVRVWTPLPLPPPPPPSSLLSPPLSPSPPFSPPSLYANPPPPSLSHLLLLLSSLSFLPLPPPPSYLDLPPRRSPQLPPLPLTPVPFGPA